MDAASWIETFTASLRGASAVFSCEAEGAVAALLSRTKLLPANARIPVADVHAIAELLKARLEDPTAVKVRAA